MKGLRDFRIVALLALMACCLLAAPPTAAAADVSGLGAADCVKCHAGPPADIAESGGKHRTDVSCLDCHPGHRPASKNNIPQCSNCHDGKDHYKLKDCLSCHKNPHRPLNIILGGKVTEACLSCHTDQIKQLKESPSKHTGLFCTNCHDVHRKVPECVKCHKPHSAEMAQADCRKCHKAHRPKAVAYGPDVPNKDCGACHKKALGLLASSQARHQGVACVKCHNDVHKTVPQCAQCHPNKHPAPIMARFPKCGTCHNIAHDLNHWAESATSGGKAEATKAESAKTTGKRKKK